MVFNKSGDISKLYVDLINFKKKEDYKIYKPDILVSKDNPNLRCRKIYRTRYPHGNENKVLENYEDWYGLGLLPNTTYTYKLGLYNYLNIEYQKDDQDKEKEEDKYTSSKC